MTLWLFLGGYGAAWLLTARLLFGWWRAGGTVGSKKRRDCEVHGSARDDDGHRRRRPSCCHENPAGSDGELTVCAMLGALAWPVFLAAALVRARAPATPAEQAMREKERAAELAASRARCAELERDLGLENDHA